jgi:membrane protease YdiL (CAAX protease family)
MEEIIRSLSPRTEFFIVIGLAFGYMILGSLIWAIAPGAQAPISEEGLQSLVAYEAIVLGVLYVFLKLRGWTVARLSEPFASKDLWLGAGFSVLVILTWTLLDAIAESLIPGLKIAADNAALVHPGFAMSTVVFASALNALYEEVFVCAYTIAALREGKGDWTAMHASVAIRLLYHLYQGAVGVIAIVPYGLFCAIWYTRTRRLWPLICTHALLDALALLVNAVPAQGT